MPPRSSLTSSFSITDTNNEVTCPLRNQDGSSCRKRCVGEKKYRSMQEHIRRAHPEHYISKLPATEESFLLMINTPPSERPAPTAGPSSIPHQNKGYLLDSAFHRDNSSAPGTPRISEEYPPAYLPAAAALAQLGNHNLEPEWEPEPVSHLPSPIDWHIDADKSILPRSTIELPPIAGFPTSDPAGEAFPNFNHGRQRDLLPSILAGSPPGRSSTLPPLHGALKPNRSRKDSVTKKGKHPQHQKKRSKGSATDWLRRIQDVGNDRLRPGLTSKAMSAEPSSHGTRWEDLLDAATSATEDIDEDRTPVGPLSPNIDPSVLTFQVPQSPISIHRASLPPFPQQAFQSYQASPLQQALTPPTYVQELHEPFPSVESTGDSGVVFNMDARGLADSSPSYTSSQNPQIYCAACQSVSLLRQSYACTECICGLCQRCVEVLMDEQGSRRKCPRCNTIGGRFKPFQLDIR